MVASLNALRSVPSSSIFWKSLRRIGTSSLYVWENSPVKPSGLGHLFVGRCKITDSISVLMISQFKLSIYSWFSFGGLYASRTCPFLPACQIYWHIIVHSIFFFPCSISCYVLHFLFCLCSLSLLLCEPGQRFVNLVYLFKEPVLGFTDFSTYFFIFILFLLWSLLFPSFYSF